MPSELAEYLNELGDGFAIEWETAEGNRFNCGLSFIEDIASAYSGMQKDLQRLASDESGSTPDAVRQEARRRLAWVPIMGVGEGGYMFCLDTAATANRVTYFDIRWVSHTADHWRSSFGDSLLDLICQWGRFCFSDPVTATGEYVSLPILADRLAGPFDWHPSNFLARFDRGTTAA